MIKVRAFVGQHDFKDDELSIDLSSAYISDILEPRGLAIHWIEEIMFALEQANDMDFMLDIVCEQWVDFWLQKIPRTNHSNGMIVPTHFKVIKVDI